MLYPFIAVTIITDVYRVWVGRLPFSFGTLIVLNTLAVFFPFTRYYNVLTDNQVVTHLAYAIILTLLFLYGDNVWIVSIVTGIAVSLPGIWTRLTNHG